MNEITANQFRKIIGLKSLGTSSKYVAKGLIVLDEFTKMVDVNKSIEALLNGREEHRAMAQKAIDYFRGVINENNVQDVINAVNHDTVIEHNPPRNQALISENSNNFYQKEKVSLVDAMTEKNLIEIKLKQLQVNEKVGNLIPREAVLNVFENIFIQLKKDLLNLARSKIDEILREKDNPRVAEKILYDGIYEILDNNSKVKQ